MNIPKLEPVPRSREYNNYSDEIRDKIIYSWLFSSEQSHRKLDKVILNMDSEYSRGFQSMGILHHLGIKEQHKDIFKGITIDEAIELMTKQDETHFIKVIEALKRYNNTPNQPRVFNS